ncbi:hypothetical protein Sjap_004434 [Stephania japonica]|uniref:Pentatricopeptide repeat-containing protein n=1 Tax=Stephania japonica TaxID=461633 RepID=A0AAP0K2J1_9MAGN
MEEALKLLNNMEESFVGPDSFTVSAVINGCCKKGDMEGALAFYDEDFKNQRNTREVLGDVSGSVKCVFGRIQIPKEYPDLFQKIPKKLPNLLFNFGPGCRDDAVWFTPTTTPSRCKAGELPAPSVVGDAVGVNPTWHLHGVGTGTPPVPNAARGATTWKAFQGVTPTHVTECQFDPHTLGTSNPVCNNPKIFN